MAFTRKQQERIVAAIGQKAPGMLHCAVCQNQNWTVAEGMVALTLQERLGALTIGGKVLPCVPLICNTCGNTILLNLKVLGLGDIAEPEAKSNSES